MLPVKQLFGDNVPLLESTGVDLAADVYERDNGVVVEMQVPGIQPDGFDIKLEKNNVIVSGKRESDVETEDRDYYRREIQRGSFERRIALPEGDYSAEISPQVVDGVLKIFIPKK